MTIHEKLVELLMEADVEDSISENTTQHREFTADHLIANGVTLNQWMPVTELPKEG